MTSAPSLPSSGLKIGHHAYEIPDAPNGDTGRLIHDLYAAGLLLGTRLPRPRHQRSLPGPAAANSRGDM